MTSTDGSRIPYRGSAWRNQHFRSLFLQFFLPQITFVSSGKPPRTIRDALRDLVPFGQFKKCEKHLWKNVTFSKVASASM